MAPPAQQLTFAAMAQPAPTPPADREFVRGVAVDRSGMAAYVHLIRAEGDPERSERPIGGRLDRSPHRTLAEVPVEDSAQQILGLLADGVPRTFNAIGVELLDHTADTLFGSPYDAALWRLVGDGQLEHTLAAPVFFRLAVGDAPPSDEERSASPVPLTP
jgi:hypothetical protein